MSLNSCLKTYNILIPHLFALYTALHEGINTAFPIEHSPYPAKKANTRAAVPLP